MPFAAKFMPRRHGAVRARARCVPHGGHCRTLRERHLPAGLRPDNTENPGYLHLYVGDDPALCLHDHPWPSLSLCLRGVIMETRQTPTGAKRTSAISPGTLAYRPARFAHRLELASTTAVTIFLAGPHLREWGWHLPTGWRHWRAISAVDVDGVTRVRIPGPPREIHEDTP